MAATELGPSRSPAADQPLCFDSALTRQRAKGLDKYGIELHTFNGRSALRDFAEEIADALQYGTQAIMEDPLRAAEVLEAVAFLQAQLVKVATIVGKKGTHE